MSNKAQRQGVFNTVATHLLTQRRRSERKEWLDKWCAYRGAGGRTCAVGCLVKDEFYRPEIEGFAVGYQAVNKAVAKSIGIPLDSPLKELLISLQAVHDNTGVRQWQRALKLVADEHGLSDEVVK